MCVSIQYHRAERLGWLCLPWRNASCWEDERCPACTYWRTGLSNSKSMSIGVVEDFFQKLSGPMVFKKPPQGAMAREDLFGPSKHGRG